MRAILKFDLLDEDDKNDYNLMMGAKNMYSVIEEIRAALRSHTKHGIREDIKTAAQYAEHFQDTFYETLQKYPIPEGY